MHNESGLEAIDTSLKKLTQGGTCFDFETSRKECSLTNKYKNKTLRQDMASLKQTKNFKRIIDAYPLVGTGGGGKIKNKIIANKNKIVF